MEKSPTYRATIQWMLCLTTIIFFWGCAHHRPLPKEPYQLAYQIQGEQATKQIEWAPVFVVYGQSRDYNRIGRPTVSVGHEGGEKVFIDTGNPVVYYMERSFTTKKATYTNLIYRVHFPGTPYSLVPFNLSAGKNVGLMVVVTIDDNQLPVLVTTVHTCGCYKAIVPTQYLSREALPEGWSGERLRVYGEKLPMELDFENVPSPRILVHLRPEVHRVMNLDVRSSQHLRSDRFRILPMQMEPMERLERLPFNGGTASLYHNDGVLKGHVKGSVKPLETLFMSLISMDLFVGTDKAYADSAQTGNRFYTSLKPWRREDSDMWNFARFLKYWGWRL